MKCLKCGNEFKILTKIDGKIKNLSSRKYCLSCSPFNQRNTKKIHEIPSVLNGFKKCPICKEDHPLENFFVKKNGRLYSYCKKCWLEITKKGNTKRKQEAVDYLGGKCVRCGYGKCLAALEFHHKDPEKKDFAISRRWSFEKIKNELDKCELVCSNCHKEIHQTVMVCTWTRTDLK